MDFHWAKPTMIMVRSDFKVYKLSLALIVYNGRTPINLRRLMLRPSETGFIPAGPLLLFIFVLVLLELTETP